MKTKTSTKTNYEKRIEKAKAQNEKRIEKTKEQIEKVIVIDTITNQVAKQLIQTIKDTKSKDNEKVANKLYELATIQICSKIKHINNDKNTYNKNNDELKKDIVMLMLDTEYKPTKEDKTKYQKEITFANGIKTDRLIKRIEQQYQTKYNKEGDKITVCNDLEVVNGCYDELCKLSVCEKGFDLLHETICKTLYLIDIELQKVNYNYNKLDINILLQPYEKVILHSTTYKNTNEQKPKEFWKYKTTNHLKEISLFISQYITNQKAVRTNEKSYHSLECELNGISYEKYVASDKIAVDDGETQTTNITIQEQIKNIIQKANFTKNQAYIFKWYMCNDKTKEQITHTLKISDSYFDQTVAKIREKIVDTGIFTGITKEQIQKPNNEQKQKQINCYKVDNDNKEFICCFDSLGLASATLKIDKSNISKVLKGKLQQTKGYIFEIA